MSTPSKAAAIRAAAAAKAANPHAGKKIRAIIHVTIYEDFTDTELKFSAEPIGFDELSREFAVVSKHMAQLHEKGNATHDFPPDNKLKEDIVLKEGE